MADFVLKDASAVINGIDHSDHVVQITGNYNAETPDNTAMGDTTRSFIPGLLVKEFQVEFHQDFAAVNLDEKIFALVGAAAFPMRVRASKTAAISTSNPEYQGNFIVQNYPIFGNAVGDHARTTVTFISGDGAALVRDVTP